MPGLCGTYILKSSIAQEDKHQDICIFHDKKVSDTMSTVRQDSLSVGLKLQDTEGPHNSC